MKIGVSSYSYQRLLKSGEMDIFDVIKKTKELGFDAIEFSDIPAKTYEERYKKAGEIKKACDESDLHIVNFSIAANLISGSNWNIEQEIDRVKKEIDIASVLGVDKMRHDVSFGFQASDPKARTLEHYLEGAASACRELASYGQSLGIKTMVENHGRYFQHSNDVLALYHAVDHDNFGILLDIGNFMCVDQDPVEAVAQLAPYTFHVHFKDFHYKSGMEPNPGIGWFLSSHGNYLRGSIIGHGNAPLKQCMNILKVNGYKGVLSIEFEGLEENILAIESGKQYLHALI